MGRDRPDRSESPVRGRRSPHRRSPSRRERSPTQHKSSRRGDSPPSEKHYSHTKSPKPERTNSYAPRSPSPRTKRLRKAQADKGTVAVAEKNHEKIIEKGTDGDYARDPNRERNLDMEAVTDRKARRSVRERDDGDRKSSRSRYMNSTSPSERHHKSRHRSESPRKAPESKDRHEVKNSRGAERRMEEEDDDSVAKMKATEEALETKEKQKPSFELSGKLAAETNRVRGVTLLFTEPPEARKPDVRWRLYVFKAGEVLNEPLYIHRQSCYLFGRERRVADIPTDHPSCSKQHAVIQFRQVEKEQPDGLMKKHIRPYLMDLGSTNKTFINDNAVEPQRYYELFERDTVRFGNSSREYVLLHENSAA